MATPLVVGIPTARQVQSGMRGLTIAVLSRQVRCLQCFDAVGWAAGRASGCKKIEWWGAGMVVCLELGADLHMAQLMTLPLTVSCLSKIQIGFAFLVLAHPGSPGKRVVKRVCVCVCVCEVWRQCS